LKLHYDEPLSNLAFAFNLRHYNAAGAPDWMVPHYLSDEHRGAGLESAFRSPHLVVPLLTHPAFVDVSTRVIIAAVLGRG
jgi:hypothetical protein